MSLIDSIIENELMYDVRIIISVFLSKKKRNDLGSYYF